MYARSSSGPDGLHLVVPSATVRERITTRYLPLVQDALRDAGADDIEVVFDVDFGPGSRRHGIDGTLD